MLIECSLTTLGVVSVDVTDAVTKRHAIEETSFTFTKVRKIHRVLILSKWRVSKQVQFSHIISVHVENVMVF